MDFADQKKRDSRGIGRADLDDAYQNAARHAPKTASRWVDRFQQALDTLSRNPQRCPLSPESRFVDEDIHEFHFGRRPNVFRVFFWIDEPYVFGDMHRQWEV